MTDFQGAVGTDLAASNGINSSDYSVIAFLPFSGFTHNAALVSGRVWGRQRQWNITDQVSWSFGQHQIKFGLDTRTLRPVQARGNPNVLYEYLSDAAVNSNTSDFASAQSTVRAQPHFLNFSAFAQDSWHLAQRFNLSFGLRWEVNPAPTADENNLPYTLEGNIGDPSTLSLAPRGTPLWKTSWYNFAPRLGAAYVLRSTAGSGAHEDW